MLHVGVRVQELALKSMPVPSPSTVRQTFDLLVTVQIQVYRI